MHVPVGTCHLSGSQRFAPCCYAHTRLVVPQAPWSKKLASFVQQQLLGILHELHLLFFQCLLLLCNLLSTHHPHTFGTVM